jgi:FixJ family two-component response regulator
MKGGAIEFLTKPFRDQDLLDAIQAGLARDRARRESDSVLAALKERFDMLSSREREVMLGVVAGRLNKQIANDIGISESTVKVHRVNLMRKMKVRSLPELSRMADLLNIRPQQPQTARAASTSSTTTWMSVSPAATPRRSRSPRRSSTA